ncbi:MAG: 2-hydroxyacid dehydrogenase [Gammaproteobacteria bacterium]
MKALLVGSESTPYVEVLRSALRSEWELVCLDRYSPDEPPSPHFANADVLISIRFDHTWPAIPQLRLLQAPAAGLNAIQFDAVPAHVPICNSYGHQIAIAEYCILAMLASAHDLLRIHREFSGGHWCWSGVPAHPQHDEIYGATVCLIGLGRIGLETARRAKAMGMRVLACNRTVKNPPPAEVDELTGLSNAASLVKRADFVIVNCALTPETTGLVDSGLLAAMKPTAFLINVSRGPLIDEEALYRALHSRQIAGAVLDVWYRYPTAESPHPRPSAFPFHELENVVMTPHVSGWTRGMVRRRWAEVAANLDHLAAHEPLINVLRSPRARSET